MQTENLRSSANLIRNAVVVILEDLDSLVMDKRTIRKEIYKELDKIDLNLQLMRKELE